MVVDAACRLNSAEMPFHWPPAGFLQSQLPAQAFNNGLGLGGLLNTIHGMSSTNMTVAEGAQGGWAPCPV